MIDTKTRKNVGHNPCLTMSSIKPLKIVNVDNVWHSVCPQEYIFGVCYQSWVCECLDSWHIGGICLLG